MQHALAEGSKRVAGQILSRRWKLVRLLGEGGMGAVFEADGLNGEGKRAIKILHPEFCAEEEVLRRFYAEAETAKKLDHPNIARVFDLATAEDGTPYIVMELLEGIPLSAYVRPGVPHPVERAAPIIHAVLQALVEAHQRGIVHRDLKPENIFLVRQPTGQFAVKVLDFGIAKVMDAAGGMGSKTKTGVLLGTPGYMSPEQLKNAKMVDPRSDLWSVGIMFYEMLTGAEAFQADTEFGRLTAVLTQEPIPIETHNAQLSPWTAFFTRALSKELEGRFQSADEMAHALLALARGKSVEPPQPAAPRHVTHQSARLPDQLAKGPSGAAVKVTTGRTPPTILPWMLGVAIAASLVLGFLVGFFVGRA